MEDILAVYQRVYGKDEVLVCMDETSKQQVKETRIPFPPRMNSTGKFDYENERNGGVTCSCYRRHLKDGGM
jgi:hypothetical protein